MNIYKKELKDALAWADQACKLVDRETRRGDYRILQHLHPALRLYYREAYYRQGPRMSGQMFAAMYPDAAAAIVGLRGNYVNLTRLVEAFDAAKLAKMSDEEIAGLLDYLTARIRDKADLERTIAGKTPEELQDLIDLIRAELAKRAQQAKKEAEKSKPQVTAEALRAAVLDLAGEVSHDD